MKMPKRDLCQSKGAFALFHLFLFFLLNNLHILQVILWEVAALEKCCCPHFSGQNFLKVPSYVQRILPRKVLANVNAEIIERIRGILYVDSTVSNIPTTWLNSECDVTSHRHL